MKKGLQSISIFIASVILFASCSSTTMIQSTPEKAKVYVDGVLMGETPYMYRDSKIVGSTISLKIEKEGYKPVLTSITKDEEPNIGAIVGGLICVVPFLWTMQYQPVHHYFLNPVSDVPSTPQSTPQATKSAKTKVERLRELKQLLDEKVINNEEFEKEKTKILNSED